MFVLDDNYRENCSIKVLQKLQTGTHTHTQGLLNKAVFDVIEEEYFWHECSPFWWITTTHMKREGERWRERYSKFITQEQCLCV